MIIKVINIKTQTHKYYKHLIVEITVNNDSKLYTLYSV